MRRMRTAANQRDHFDREPGRAQTMQSVSHAAEWQSICFVVPNLRQTLGDIAALAGCKAPLIIAPPIGLRDTIRMHDPTLTIR